MAFIISLVLAAALAWAFAGSMKKHATIWYIGAVVIAAVVCVMSFTGKARELPEFVSTWIWPLFARGALAGALFAIVMWLGALSNTSAVCKKLMPIRGELSILASILTLGHNIAFGKHFFVVLFVSPSELPRNQFYAAIVSLILIVIMLPLMVTSFTSVRKRMKAVTWKKLQRLAYAFYAGLYIHILLLMLPKALGGDMGYWFVVAVYSVVFVGYAVKRIHKAMTKKVAN